ncbi:MAG: hypothetical protein CL610_14160 [Anaerolineaceae bacterium]|nr:hypothetical protein [Anaerolineaceae bacterium]
MVSYPLDRLHEEVAFIAIGLGWSHHEILSLTHQERARWVQQVNRVNRRRNSMAHRREES